MPYQLFQGRLLEEGEEKCRKGWQGIVFLTNRTPYTLNAAIKVPALCHFYNGLQPNETVYFRTGYAIVTLEVQVAHAIKKNDYTRASAIGQNMLFAGGLVSLGLSIANAAVALAPLAAIGPGMAVPASSAPGAGEVVRDLAFDAGPTALGMVKDMVPVSPVSLSCIRAGRSPRFEVVVKASGEKDACYLMLQPHSPATSRGASADSDEPHT